jgi:hypothetical protein
MVAQKAPWVGEGTLGRHGIHLPTVAWLILMPSLSSSPWNGAPPTIGLALLNTADQSTDFCADLGSAGRRDRQRLPICSSSCKRAHTNESVYLRRATWLLAKLDIILPPNL